MKKSLWKVIAISLLLAVSSAAYLWNTKDSKSRVASVIQFNLGDKAFYVPENYIWDKSTVRKREPKHINMMAEYPSMRPYLHEGNKASPSTGWSNGKVTFYVAEEYAVDIETKRINALLESLDYQLKSEGEDFTVYESKTLHSEFYVSNDDAWLKSAECHKERDVDYPFFPSCRVISTYSEEIILKYSFSRDLLPVWRDIDRKITNLVKFFEKN